MKGTTLARLIALMSGTAVLARGLSGPAFFAGYATDVSLMKVDSQWLATGMQRLSELVMASQCGLPKKDSLLPA